MNSIKFESKAEGTDFVMFTFLKGYLYFRMFVGNSILVPFKSIKMSELCSQEQNYFMYQPISFRNPPRKDDCQTDYFLQKMPSLSDLFLKLHSLFLKMDPGTGKFLASAAHKPCWGFAKEGFWSCIHGTLFPGRSAFCQLSLRSRGFPPSHFHLSTCLIFIILSCFSIYCVVQEGLCLIVVEDYICTVFPLLLVAFG